MSELASSRCGYTWPEDHELDADPNHQSCCWRETIQESDSCVWHADPVEVSKSIEALQEVRAPPEIREQNRQHSLFESDTSDFEFTELLDGSNLAEFNFNGDISVKRVSIRQGNLRGTNFQNADLSYANFQDADLSNANLQNADLSNANLQDADLSDANLQNADLYDANLQNANLSNANIKDSEFFLANITDADLTDTYAYDADLRRASLSNAELRRANLSHADLSEADLSKATLSESNLTHINLRDANLSYANLSEATLSNANLSEATLSNANFSDTDCKRADFSGGFLLRANCSNADLRKTDFSEGHLVEATLDGAEIEMSTFNQADLSEASLNATDCEGAEFVNAVLVRASLENADLVRTDLTGAHLFGAHTDGARISSRTKLGVDGEIGEVTANDRCRYDTDSPPNGPVESLALDEDYLEEADESPRVIQFRRGRSTYRRLEELARQNGLLSLRSSMFVRRQEITRKLFREKNEYMKWVFAEVQRLLFMYGESFRRILAVSLGIVALFWLVFLTSGTVETVDGDTVTANAVADNPILIWEALYHSISVFFAGNAPLVPTGPPGQIFIALERISGPILLAMLIFVLGRRAAR